MQLSMYSFESFVNLQKWTVVISQSLSTTYDFQDLNAFLTLDSVYIVSARKPWFYGSNHTAFNWISLLRRQVRKGGSLATAS